MDRLHEIVRRLPLTSMFQEKNIIGEKDDKNNFNDRLQKERLALQAEIERLMEELKKLRFKMEHEDNGGGGDDEDNGGGGGDDEDNVGGGDGDDHGGGGDDKDNVGGGDDDDHGGGGGDDDNHGGGGRKNEKKDDSDGNGNGNNDKGEGSGSGSSHNGNMKRNQMKPMFGCKFGYHAGNENWCPVGQLQCVKKVEG